MSTIVATAAVITYRHISGPRAPIGSGSRMPAATPTAAAKGAVPQSALAEEFTRFESGLRARLGVAVSAVGDGQAVTTLGDWREGPAWSTMKVPLVIAAYREQESQQVTDVMKAAITESDNAAAESLWEQLGDPATAAKQVQEVLRQSGDPTMVESRKLRPEFTAFGQTIWSLANQVRFTANAFCNNENAPIFDLMSQIKSDQRWGIGDIPETSFKGGWGPSPSGKYLVRQLGVLTTPAGEVAVAIAAEPGSGSFDDGTKDLDDAARWLHDHLGALPVGKCSH